MHDKGQLKNSYLRLLVLNKNICKVYSQLTRILFSFSKNHIFLFKIELKANAEKLNAVAKHSMVISGQKKYVNMYTALLIISIDCAGTCVECDQTSTDCTACATGEYLTPRDGMTEGRCSKQILLYYN